MESVTVKNFRCFREEQTTRLAPLTLLVGENSTGKTSFLALLRALCDVAFRQRVPDFRQPPYDLGSFEDIVHSRGTGDEKAADSFEAGFQYWRLVGEGEDEDLKRVSFQTTFRERQGVPYPVVRTIADKETWVTTFAPDEDRVSVKFGTQEGEWERTWGPGGPEFPLIRRDDALVELIDLIVFSMMPTDEGRSTQSTSISGRDFQTFFALVTGDDTFSYPYAGAPVRSYPRRTYDPIRPTPDPEGEYIPTYLANMSRRNPAEWKSLKSNLEKFGRQSGLFDEIEVKSFGDSVGFPFQLHIGKRGKQSMAGTRNLIDVGYGVSQTLPLITELFSPEPASMFLLQQPEVHLHPSAQAALGTLFCEIANPQRQLVVETHSDYIIDRVLMDIRDKKTSLGPDDVSILYFEPNDLDVTIHSLRVDDKAKIIDPPGSYRQFFLDELRRSVGL